MSRVLILAGLGAWSTVCQVWLWILILQFRARRRKLFLSAAPSGSEVTAGSVRVIVPVRNSGQSVGPCVRSVLAQDDHRLRLTLVNDRSEDDTAARLEAFARTDDRIDLLHIAELPAGWLGKSHALWQASQYAGEDWLLFLDDDCVLDPPAVRTALGHAREQNADLLTLWPRHLAGSFWEHALIPLCGGMIALWFGTPDVNSDRSSVAFANGQFLLVRREAYARFGGHAAVRDAIIEDVPLAEAARKAGLRCRVASGADLLGVRMYHDYRGVVDGWTRIFVGALRSGLKLVLTMLWLVLGNLLPYLTLPTVLLGGAMWPTQLAWAGSAVVTLAIIHLLLMMLVSYRFWGMGRCDRRYLWIYPLSVIIVLRIVAAAWYRLVVRRRISWRRTEYAIDGSGRILSG